MPKIIKYILGFFIILLALFFYFPCFLVLGMEPRASLIHIPPHQTTCPVLHSTLLHAFNALFWERLWVHRLHQPMKGPWHKKSLPGSSRMAQQVKFLTAKPDEPRFTRWKERTSSHKLLSDLHMDIHKHALNEKTKLKNDLKKRFCLLFKNQSP